MGLTKPGKCSSCGKEGINIVNRKHMLCQVCNHERLHGSKPKRQRISSLSTKQSIKLADYFIAKRKYIQRHPLCEVRGCKNQSQDIHHKKGRVGENLVDTKHFLAVCRSCHIEIESNPEWAYKNGYSVKRLS
jgi:DNA-directed RNA polymerase subunit RPC12/RpoP